MTPTTTRTRLDTVPQQRTAPSAEEQRQPGDGSAGGRGGPSAPAQHGSRAGAVAVLMAVVVLLAVLVATVVTRLQADARAEAEAVAAQAVTRVARSVDADEAFVATRQQSALLDALPALAASQAAASETALTSARAVLDSSPHAGDAPRAALQQALDAAVTARAGLGEGTNLAALRSTTESVAVPQQAVTEAEAAWVAAEAARVAAEQAAAQAAAQEAARRSAAPARTPAGRPATTRAPSTAPAAGAPAAAASAWAAGVQSYGVGGLGAAINQARADNGLPGLSVQSSSSLTDHAAAMAAAWSIWHSGNDHIVGWVQPVSDSAMINAYMNSPGHRAWILREGKTRVSIGAVTLNGRLFTAMSFS